MHILTRKCYHDVFLLNQCSWEWWGDQFHIAILMEKYFKPSVFILSLVPFLIIIYKIYFNQLGPEPVKEITHHTGEWTLIFICLTLSMSPLKRFTNLAVWVKFRRMLGLFVFFYATIHLLTYIGLDYKFDWQPILNDVLNN